MSGTGNEFGSILSGLLQGFGTTSSGLEKEKRDREERDRRAQLETYSQLLQMPGLRPEAKQLLLSSALDLASGKKGVGANVAQTLASLGGNGGQALGSEQQTKLGSTPGAQTSTPTGAPTSTSNPQGESITVPSQYGQQTLGAQPSVTGQLQQAASGASPAAVPGIGRGIFNTPPRGAFYTPEEIQEQELASLKAKTQVESDIQTTAQLKVMQEQFRLTHEQRIQEGDELLGFKQTAKDTYAPVYRNKITGKQTIGEPIPGFATEQMLGIAAQYDAQYAKEMEIAERRVAAEQGVNYDTATDEQKLGFRKVAATRVEEDRKTKNEYMRAQSVYTGARAVATQNAPAKGEMTDSQQAMDYDRQSRQYDKEGEQISAASKEVEELKTKSKEKKAQASAIRAQIQSTGAEDASTGYTEANAQALDQQGDSLMQQARNRAQDAQARWPGKVRARGVQKDSRAARARQSTIGGALGSALPEYPEEPSVDDARPSFEYKQLPSMPQRTLRTASPSGRKWTEQEVRDAAKQNGMNANERIQAFKAAGLIKE